MLRTLLSLAAVALVSCGAALADGKTDPGFKAAFEAAGKGQRVKLAIGKDTVSTCPLRCDSVDGFQDGIVEVYLEKGEPGWEPYVRWTAKPIAPVVVIPDTTVYRDDRTYFPPVTGWPNGFPNFAQPTCPNGTCPNVRYYR